MPPWPGPRSRCCRSSSPPPGASWVAACRSWWGRQLRGRPAGSTRRRTRCAQAQANVEAQQGRHRRHRRPSSTRPRYFQELTIIRAPADGRIVRRYANPGGPAPSTLNVSNMFDLVPANPRIVRAEITEGALPFVLIGPGRCGPWRKPTPAKTISSKVLRRATVFGLALRDLQGRTTRRKSPTNAWSRWSSGHRRRPLHSRPAGAGEVHAYAAAGPGEHARGGTPRGVITLSFSGGRDRPVPAAWSGKQRSEG